MSRIGHRFLKIAAVLIVGRFAVVAEAEDAAAPKPVPQVQVVPQPYAQAAVEVDRFEITRYHFGSDLKRPFVFPVLGPSGASLTRMGHPRDPNSHSHHNSVWVSHHKV